MERMNNLVELCELYTRKWPALSEHDKRQYSKTLAVAFQNITDKTWRQKTWTAMQPYQRILGRIINYLPGNQI